MSLSHHYPEFGTPKGPFAITDAAVPDPSEEARLAVYDEGFQAGWDDATKALHEEARDAVSGINQRLQDMSFTFEEARTSLLRAQVPVLTQIIGKLVPAAVAVSLGPRLQDAFDRLLSGELDESLSISVAPEAVDYLQDCLGSAIARPFSLVADPLLEPGAVVLGVRNREEEMNFKPLVEEITAGIEAYLNLAKEARTDA